MPEALASNSTYVFHYKGNTSPPKVPTPGALSLSVDVNFDLVVVGQPIVGVS